MAKFIKNSEINSELEKLIENADSQLILISPFIKMHDRVKSLLKRKIENPQLEVTVIFGKNPENKEKSINAEDLSFLKELPNIEIRYEERLHAKYYANDDSAILTSMNLYDFSQNNNVEFGILTKATFLGSYLNIGDPIDKEAYEFANEIIESSLLMFEKRPIKEKRRLYGQKFSGESEVVVDNIDSNFRPKENIKKSKPVTLQGYCIRTGQNIKFNPERPFTYKAYKDWAKFENPEYPEKYCHFSGEPSNGNTSQKHPILKKNWQKAKEVHNF